MSTINGNLDGYAEVILKMDDVTGEIKEVTVKAINGELSTVENLGKWLEDNYTSLMNSGIKYTLESMNNTVNCGNVTKFLTESLEHTEANNKLADLATLLIQGYNENL